MCKKTKTLKKILYILVCILVIVSCYKNEPFVGNNKLIEIIDTMDLSETRYKIKVNADKTNRDTVQIRSIKKDSSNKEVYQEWTYWLRGVKYIRQGYYRNITGMFYEKTKSEDDYFEQTYETFLKNKKNIDKARMNTKFRGEEESSIDMVFEYKRNIYGKLKVLNIYLTMDTSRSKLESVYNDEEKVIKEIHYTNQTGRDTIETREFVYVNSKLNSYFFRKLHGSKKEMNLYYDENEKLISELEIVYEFDEDKIAENWTRKYYYNEAGLLIFSIETDIISNTENQYIYEYKK